MCRGCFPCAARVKCRHVLLHLSSELVGRPRLDRKQPKDWCRRLCSAPSGSDIYSSASIAYSYEEDTAAAMARTGLGVEGCFRPHRMSSCATCVWRRCRGHRRHRLAASDQHEGPVDDPPASTPLLLSADLRAPPQSVTASNCRCRSSDAFFLVAARSDQVVGFLHLTPGPDASSPLSHSIDGIVEPASGRCYIESSWGAQPPGRLTCSWWWLATTGPCVLPKPMDSMSRRSWTGRPRQRADGR